MDYGPFLWIDKSTKQNINEDSFLRILASIFFFFFNFFLMNIKQKKSRIHIRCTPPLNRARSFLTAKLSVFKLRSATKPENRLREKVEELHIWLLFVASDFDLLQHCIIPDNTLCHCMSTTGSVAFAYNISTGLKSGGIQKGGGVAFFHAFKIILIVS